jgi:HK97 family phage portal protein
MSALTTLKSLITGGDYQTPQAVRDLALPTSDRKSVEVFGPTGQRAADWSLATDTTKLSQAARVCVTVYACATFLADAVAESPLRVYRWVDGEPVDQPQHRFRQLISQPNPYMSEAEFITLVVMTMAYTGYSMVEKVRSAAGLPVELWPLRPDWMGRNRENTQWVYRVPNNDPRPINDDDLLIIPYRHDDRMSTWGVSPLHVAAREIGIEVALTDMLKAAIDAGGIPVFAVTLPESKPDQVKVDAFREGWKQRYGGLRGMTEPGILYGGMDIKILGQTFNQMALPDLRSMTELKIAQAFRVPADLIQAKETLNGGSLTTTEMEGAMSALQRYGAAPLRTRIDGAFTRGLLYEFTGGDPQYSVEFDTSDIPALQEDMAAIHERVRLDFAGSLITQNEARLAMGLEPVAGGDVFSVPFSAVFVQSLTSGTGQEEERGTRNVPGGTKNVPAQIPATTHQKTQERRYRDTKAMSPVELELRAAGIRRTAKDRQALADILNRKLRSFWKEQGDRVVAGYAKSSANGPDVKDAALLDWSREDDLLEELLERFYGTSGERAFTTAGATLGAELAWDLANPRVRDVMTELGLRIVGISDTTRQDVARVITDGVGEGLGVDKIAEELRGLFEETYKGRAQTVARTESMHSYNLASGLAYEEAGVQEVELLDNRDHDTDPGPDGLTCAERDGLIVSVTDVAFHTNAEHPNGSLAVAPIVSLG